MHKNDILIGETYLFLTTDSPARKHLQGQPFTVVAKPRVWRKFARRGKVKTWKVTRIQNDNGDLARPEELGEMPAGGLLEMSFDFNAKPLPTDGTTVVLENQEPGWNHDWSGAHGATQTFNDEWLDVGHKPERDGLYNVVTLHNRLIISGYVDGVWGYDQVAEDDPPLGREADRVVRYRPSTFKELPELEDFLETEPINPDGDGLRDTRENPCPICDTGEMGCTGVHPNGQEQYECNQCGHRCSFP
jgi:hypothetical protein